VRTFEYVAEQWLTFKSAELVTKSFSGFNGALNNHILPAIGKKPVSEIKLEHITTIKKPPSTCARSTQPNPGGQSSDQKKG
jgi:hypothetical protein